MQVMVSGKHVNVGEALRTRVTDDLLASIGKYFERGGDAEVVVSRDGHGFRVDCVVALASGQRLLSHGQASEAHGAFSVALAKIETRIRRYKRRLKSHTVAASAKAAETASLMVLRAPDEADEDDGWDGVVVSAQIVCTPFPNVVKGQTRSLASAFPDTSLTPDAPPLTLAV